jgi:hypothetical protein
MALTIDKYPGITPCFLSLPTSAHTCKPHSAKAKAIAGIAGWSLTGLVNDDRSGNCSCWEVMITGWIAY